MTCDRSEELGLAGAVEAAGLDTVAGAFAYEGGDDFDKPGLGHRRRTRITLADKTGRPQELYLKRYGPEPIKTRFDRLIKGGGLATAAEVEFPNIVLAAKAGVATMEPVICGADKTGRSYLVVTAVPGDAMERCFDQFLAESDAAAVECVTNYLAEFVGKFHGAGAVHRDLYASHVFLHADSEGPELYLIDLARVFRPRLRRFRWQVKDLAQLKYSMPPAWVDSYWPLFMDTYLADRPGGESKWSAAIDRKVASMVRRAERKARR